MKNVIKSLAKIVLIPLVLTASAADAEVNKKVLVSGNTTALMISNDEM